MIFDEGLRLDVLVEELIICELKAVDELNPVWERLPAAINDGSTVLLRYSRLEAAPTR